MKMLKTKFTFMLGNNMKWSQRFKLILLLLFSTHISVFTQTDEIKFQSPKSVIMLSTPYLPHAIVTNGEQGFSFTFSYPGFFSYWGQASLYYTNSLGDSYFGSIGEVYVMLGMNKQIIKFQKSKFYINANLGIIPDRYGYLGSLGISQQLQRTPKSKIEIVLDLFFNHGINGDMMVHDKTYSIGILAGVNLTHNLTANFQINFGFGLSLMQYRYMREDMGYYEYEYIYVSKRTEKYNIDNNLSDLPKWNTRFLIPFGITISYHF